MAEKEVVIKISAKNLTEGEFQKARQALAGLGDEADKTKGKTSGLGGAFAAFGKAAPGALKAVAVAAAAAGAAIVTITTAVVKLGARGAVVSDVQSAFDRLSASVGTTGATMLGALQAGVKGTLTNFQLMQLANKGLGAGLLKSASDAKTLAEGARLLAKRTGGDTAQAFETLTTAIASGRTAQLKQIGLFVDNKKAVEDYAKSTGKTVAELTDYDRATALQTATMAALRGELERNAPPLADFGEILEQGKVGVKNLVDELAVMISRSPPLLAGMNAVKDVISRAFGGEQHSLILSIVNIIEKAAFVVVELGKLGVTAAEVLYRGFAGIKVLVLGVALAFAEVGRVVAQFNASMLEQAAKIPVLGKSYKEAATNARDGANAIAGWSAGLKESLGDAAVAAAGNDSWGRSLSSARATLDGVTLAMTNAGLSQQQLNQATADGAVHNQNLANTASFVGTNLAALAPVMVDWQGKLVQTSAASVAWKEAVSQSFVETTTTAQGFASAVQGVGDVVAANSSRMEASFARFGITTRDQSKKTLEQMEKDFEAIKSSGQASAKDLEEAQRKLDEFRKKSTEDTNTAMNASNLGLVGNALGSFAELGGKFKIFAIAQAVISTYLSIAKSLAEYPWPFSLVAAAAAAAAGFANVSKIKSAQAYAKGTPNLDFADFGRESPAFLHGSEAVIPRGGGHQLAQEIARALGQKKERASSTDLLAERFDRSMSRLDDLPRAIQRAVRDGMLLAS